MAFLRMGELLGGKEPVPIGDLPERIVGATKDGSSVVDMQSIIDITDSVNALRSADQLGEVVRQVRKRLNSRDSHGRFQALHLIEALAKNCGMRFLQAIANDVKFMDVVSRLVLDGASRVEKSTRPTAVDKDVYDKSRELVQAWGEEFLPLQKEYHLEPFVKLYHSLRAKGIRFKDPQLDETRPPIFTPPVREGGGGGGGGGGGDGGGGGGKRSKEREAARPPSKPEMKGDLGVLQNTAQTLFDMLSYQSDAREAASDDTISLLLGLLDAKRGALQAAAAECILRTDPEALAVVQLNDAVNALVAAWKKFQKTKINPLLKVEEEEEEGGGGGGKGKGGVEEDGGGADDGGGDDGDDEEDLLGLGSGSGGKKEVGETKGTDSPTTASKPPPSPAKPTTSSTPPPALAPPSSSGRRRTRGGSGVSLGLVSSGGGSAKKDKKDKKDKRRSRGSSGGGLKALEPPPPGGRPRKRSRGVSGSGGGGGGDDDDDPLGLGQVLGGGGGGGTTTSTGTTDDIFAPTGSKPTSTPPSTTPPSSHVDPFAPAVPPPITAPLPTSAAVTKPLSTSSAAKSKPEAVFDEDPFGDGGPRRADSDPFSLEPTPKPTKPAASASADPFDDVFAPEEGAKKPAARDSVDPFDEHTPTPKADEHNPFDDF